MIELLRTFTQMEEIHHEFGPPPAVPRRRAAVGIVLRNPFAGRYEPDIVPMMDALKPLGLEMARRTAAALGVPLDAIDGYGKGSLVGTEGELEHGALWHVPGGYAMRALLGEARAIVPSTKKVAGPGATLDVPITHINASYVRSHFDAFEVQVPGAPQPDEIVFVLAMTSGPRVHDRLGGLRVDQISANDGLR